MKSLQKLKLHSDLCTSDLLCQVISGRAPVHVAWVPIRVILKRELRIAAVDDFFWTSIHRIPKGQIIELMTDLFYRNQEISVRMLSKKRAAKVLPAARQEVLGLKAKCNQNG